MSFSPRSSEPPQIVEATAQTFENGVMIHILANGQAPNAVYVYFYDAGHGQNRIASFRNVLPAQPDAGLVPPEGMRVPDSQFYPSWERRFEYAPLRNAVGWATGDPVSFAWQTLCKEGPGVPLICVMRACRMGACIRWIIDGPNGGFGSDGPQTYGNKTAVKDVMSVRAAPL